jgi:ribonuclease-3
MAEAFRGRLGHDFGAPDLLAQALTHRSHGTRHNERLEFVGDAVLNCVVALSLYERFPQIDEGELSRARASLVNRDTLARIARRLEIGEAVRLGEGELKSGGADRGSILADALEAVFGAVLLDAGFDAARRVIASATARSSRTPILRRSARTPRRGCRNGSGAPHRRARVRRRRDARRGARAAVRGRMPHPALRADHARRGASRSAGERARARLVGVRSDEPQPKGRPEAPAPRGEASAARFGGVTCTLRARRDVGRPSVGKSTLRQRAGRRAHQHHVAQAADDAPPDRRRRDRAGAAVRAASTRRVPDATLLAALNARLNRRRARGARGRRTSSSWVVDASRINEAGSPRARARAGEMPVDRRAQQGRRSSRQGGARCRASPELAGAAGGSSSAVVPDLRGRRATQLDLPLKRDAIRRAPCQPGTTR